MKRFLLLTAGTVIGVLIGAWYGWSVSPVTYNEISPDQLRAEYQADYVLMVAETYAADKDLGQAAVRLSRLGQADLAGLVRRIADAYQAAGYPAGGLHPPVRSGPRPGTLFHPSLGETMRKHLEWIWLPVGLILGLALGVGYAWVLRPADFRGAEPASLQPVYRGEYILLIATAYQATGNLDRARTRLELFPELSPAVLSSLAQQVVAARGSEDAARGLARLSVALAEQTPVTSFAFTVTPQSLPVLPVDAHRQSDPGADRPAASDRHAQARPNFHRDRASGICPGLPGTGLQSADHEAARPGARAHAGRPGRGGGGGPDPLGGRRLDVCDRDEAGAQPGLRRLRDRSRARCTRSPSATA